jgi:molybdate transport system substrate-binding protein
MYQMRQGITLGRPGTIHSYEIPQYGRMRLVHLLMMAFLALGLMLAMRGSTTAAEAPRVQGALTIFTAASLTDAFKDMAAEIEKANPGTKLTFNFAGSPTLRTQLAQGARADVFASADEPNMVGAEKDGSIIGEPQIFARNQLVVVVPVKNPGGIHTLQDLTKPKLKLVLTNKEVPVGNYARQALEKLSQDAAYGPEFAKRVLANLVSEETNVKQVASKVQLGEADAGIVYSTDVTPALRDVVRVIQIPPEFNVIAKYPIAAVKDSNNEAGAQAFIAYVLSPAGQTILARHGFLVSNM